MVEGGLVGQTFLFTGTLAKLKRDDAEAMAEAKGGKILSGVSSKDFVTEDLAEIRLHLARERVVLRNRDIPEFGFSRQVETAEAHAMTAVIQTA